ncbi:MAG: glycosyltransferase family 4 protein [Bacteroidales bacterium]|nr:glycosyltransferase family 4 protein [Bacteroidales bacterium]
MIIGYDAKRAFRNNSGLGNYSRMVIGGVCREGHGMVKSLLFTPTTKGRHTHYFDDIQEVEIRQPRGLWAMAGGIWRSVWSGLCARREGVDIYHGLSHELPFFLGNGVKKVVTMHDLIVRRYPKFFKPVDRIIHRLKMRHACRVADMVIAISEQTKRDLVDMMHVPEEKIRVVYQSCDPIFWNPPSTTLPPIHSAVQLPERYIIAVGTVEERKNQVAAVCALALLPEDVCLVVVGRPRGNYPQQVRRVAKELGVDHRVIFLQNAAFSDFPALYRGAVASVYMSVFEGFGIPVLESLCCDCPVVTSNVSSMPEAGGDAALYAAPDDYRTLAAHLSRLLSDSAFRNSQIEKGRTQRLKFAPEKVSQDMLALYRSLLHD